MRSRSTYNPIDISASEAEKRTLAKFRELHEKDDPRETFKLWFFMSLSLILAITGIVIILKAVDPDYNFSEKAIHYLNDLSTGAWTVIVLIALVVILAIYKIVKARKHGI